MVYLLLFAAFHFEYRRYYFGFSWCCLLVGWVVAGYCLLMMGFPELAYVGGCIVVFPSFGLFMVAGLGWLVALWVGCYLFVSTSVA